jgi:transposase
LLKKEALEQPASEKTGQFHQPEAYWHGITEDYKQKLRRAESEIERLKKQNNTLSHEFDELKETLAQVHPPAWIQPNLSLQSDRKHKKRGPKVGHIPYWRRMPNEGQIDREVAVAPTHCPKCQTSLSAPSTWHPHTQLEIPPENRVQITRFYIGYPYCRCCQRMVCLPQNQRSGIITFGKYGPRFHGYVSYWKFGLGLTLGKIKMKLRDEYQVEISTGELTEMLKNTAKALEPIYQSLSDMLREQPCIYVDETGWRMDGDNFWLWSFSNNSISYYRIQKSRGSKLPHSLLGITFQGILITDFYSSYNAIRCRKQKCWAHIIRELRDLHDKLPNIHEIKIFLKRMKYFYRRGVELQRRYQQGKDIYLGYCILRRSTDQWISREWKQPDLKRIRNRLKKHRTSLYTFIYENIDATNNRSERELRPAVLMRKVSHGNRSLQGAHAQEIILTVVRTSLRNKINYVDLAARCLTDPLNSH